MEQKIKQPYEIIKIDKYTRRIKNPTILLLNRAFDKIGKIGKYEDWNVSLVSDGFDEICFKVHKYADGILCPVWEDIIDLKIIDVNGFGRFEISVDYTDNTETIKFVHGYSLETELSQIELHDFHVNDEEAADMVYTDYSKDNYDSDGNFIPTTFYREVLDSDTQEEALFKQKHSLLHRVLADKAPHWSIGYVTPCIRIDEETEPEESSKFQRTYTVDVESIYDFLTGTVAKESNVVFVFDTVNRTVNCYSLCEDVVDPETGELKVAGIGQDTTILVSKTKLANEITLSSNKDSIKNCFRVEGGDDIITDMIPAVNMNGSRYIYQFAQFQYNDMQENLRNRLENYQTMMEDTNTQEVYYGENGIYTRLCNAYDDLAYYESAMMPDTSKVTNVGSAKEQYDKIIDVLTNNGADIAVSSVKSYDNNLFVGITNNVESYLQILIDSRFILKIIQETTKYNSSNKTWSGKIQIVQRTDNTNVYPVNVSSASPINIHVNEDKILFAKQKIQKALSKGSMLDIDFDVAGMGEPEIFAYFRKYSLNRLTSFYDGYDSCLSILIELGETVNSEVSNTIYYMYEKRFRIVQKVLEERKEDIKKIEETIEKLLKEQKGFMYGSDQYEPHDFKTYMGDLYAEFCKYRREDTYSNNNYISDGLDTSGSLNKTKELLDAAKQELKKKCTLQRTISTSLNNLFALEAFEPLYEKFALYNYIRIRTEDELLKLRLIGIEFSGNTVEEIQVTFSEQIESIEGSTGRIRNTLKKAAKMSVSYPSTALQAEKGSQANQEIQNIYTNGLDTGKAMITNNENQEVTIRSSGIIGKNMYDEGSYGDKQFRITGNTISFTNDNWKSVRMTLGENTFWNPIKKKEETAYGVFADAIVGNMIAGNNMFIGNKNGNVLISGDGIDITNGSLYVSNDDYSIELDPKHRLKDLGDYMYGISDIRNDFLFCIRDKNVPIDEENNDIIMGIDTNGNGYFNGRIQASGGKIANFDISEDKLSTNNVEFGDENGIYFGEDGLSIGDSFKVGNDGDSFFKGNIKATKIIADQYYNVWCNDHEVPIVSGKYSDFGLNWIVKLGCHNGKDIVLSEINMIDADGNKKVRTEIITDITNIYGETNIKGDLYSKTGNIITSDRNAKENIKTLTDKHIKFFYLLQPVSFTFKDGKSGRTHVGFISQDVEYAMKQSGLTDIDFAGFCKNVKMIETNGEYGNTTSQIEKDENGNDVYIYSLRYDEFIALNTFMIQNMYKENQNIKERLLRLEDKIENLERTLK